jgi:thymidylate kinase
LEMVKADPDRWMVIDAGQSWDAVQTKLREVTVACLEKNEKREA